MLTLLGFWTIYGSHHFEYKVLSLLQLLLYSYVSLISIYFNQLRQICIRTNNRTDTVCVYAALPYPRKFLTCYERASARQMFVRFRENANRNKSSCGFVSFSCLKATLTHHFKAIYSLELVLC